MKPIKVICSNCGQEMELQGEDEEYKEYECPNCGEEGKLHLDGHGDVFEVIGSIEEF